MKKQCLTLLAIVTAAFAVSAATEFEDAAKTVAEKKLPNLVKNGNFERFTPDGKFVADWTFWKSNDSKGKVTIDKTIGIANSAAVVFSGGSSALYAYVPAKPEEKYYLRTMVKRTGKKAAAIFTARFMKLGPDKKPVWQPEISTQAVKFGKDGHWTKVELIVTTPADCAFLVPMISAKNLDENGSWVVADNVEVYKLPEE
ncbi:MAG: hypothetical protein J5806_10605 [Lentisphaeria bacterium]|nr:hypothetical protein [Lentisphaeria bacterium]